MISPRWGPETVVVILEATILSPGRSVASIDELGT